MASSSAGSEIGSGGDGSGDSMIALRIVLGDGGIGGSSCLVGQGCTVLSLRSDDAAAESSLEFAGPTLKEKVHSPYATILDLDAMMLDKNWIQ